ncbi:MAG: hypothetical protein NVS9B4_04870 [Candidatus Acidiferrum sp.]
MPQILPEDLQKKLLERLQYYDDIGIRKFYRDRSVSSGFAASFEVNHQAVTSIAEKAFTEDTISPTSRSEPTRKATLPTVVATTSGSGAPTPRTDALGRTVGSSTFFSAPLAVDKTLLNIREDIGECTRCKLHKGRNKIVFGDGSPAARLLFIGEGPGRDEDLQGLPFVGRAGKLLTQMIEAMGLQRSEVYICNVVKCRPPENRAPEKDEVAACSPFLFRQIDLIAPQVIVCLGSIAAQTVLETTRGISQFRGEWLEFRGRKLMATYHPAYLLRNPSAKAEVWKDLQKVMAELGLSVKKAKPV